MGGGKVQGETVVVKAGGGGGERGVETVLEGLRGQVVERHLHGPRNHPGSP